MNPIMKIGSQRTLPGVVDQGLAGMGLVSSQDRGRREDTKHFSLHVSSGFRGCGRGGEAGAVKCSRCGETWGSQNLGYQGQPG